MSPITQRVQALIYQMIINHYLASNPILGNVDPEEKPPEEKLNFYKQAKEFFFT